MAAEDYLQDLMDMEDDEDDFVTCKFCGSTNLWWSKERTQWVLINYATGKKHVCRKTTAAQDFTNS